MVALEDQPKIGKGVKLAKASNRQSRRAGQRPGSRLACLSTSVFAIEAVSKSGDRRRKVQVHVQVHASEAMQVMKAIRPLRAARKAAALGALAFCLAVGGTARAADCNADIGALSKKRQDIIDSLNHQAKGTKNQLDPVAACPKLKALVGAERELVAYLTKNKEWCTIPDDAIANITASADKSGAVAGQACKIAAQMKKAQEQQATGGGASQGQKLPTGPL